MCRAIVLLFFSFDPGVLRHGCAGPASRHRRHETSCCRRSSRRICRRGSARSALAAVFSAEVSTCDAILFMLSTSLSKDLYKRFLKPARHRPAGAARRAGRRDRRRPARHGDRHPARGPGRRACLFSTRWSASACSSRSSPAWPAVAAARRKRWPRSSPGSRRSSRSISRPTEGIRHFQSQPHWLIAASLGSACLPRRGARRWRSPACWSSSQARCGDGACGVRGEPRR